MSKNPFVKYAFAFKIAAAALLLVIGVIILINSHNGEKLIIGFTGAAIFLLALIRIIPLLRTLKNGKSKLVCTFEILGNLIIGALLCYTAFNIEKNPDDNNTMVNFGYNYYNYLLGAILYARGIIYTALCILLKEETDKTKFWTHMVCLTCGVIVIGVNDSLVTTLSYIIAIIALLCAFVLAFDGYVGFNNHRKAIKKSREIEDSKKVVDEVVNKLPSTEEKEEIDEVVEKPEIVEPDQKDDQVYYS